MEERSQFTFYSSFADAIARIKKKADRADAYDAICNYALFAKEPDLSQMSDAAQIAFLLIKPNLDASRKKAKSGKMGGKTEANAKQNGSKHEANTKQGENASEKEKEKENECYPPTPLSPEKKQTRFTPPSVEEVKSYCDERKNTVDPHRFVDFYTANGWKVGKNPMKDWKAAVRTWERGESKSGADTGNTGSSERLGIYL